MAKSRAKLVERLVGEMCSRLIMDQDRPLLPWPELPQDLAFIAFTIDRLRRDRSPQPGKFSYADPRADRDHMAVYRDFWQEIVETGGQLDLDKVARELSDYSFIIDQLPLVYDEITGGRMSKHMYFARDVIAEANERTQELVEEAVAEAREEWRDEAGLPEPGTPAEHGRRDGLVDWLSSVAWTSGPEANAIPAHLIDAVAATFRRKVEAIADALLAEGFQPGAGTAEADVVTPTAKPFKLACFRCGTWQEFPTNDARQEWTDQHSEEMGCMEFRFVNDARPADALPGTAGVQPPAPAERPAARSPQETPDHA